MFDLISARYSFHTMIHAGLIYICVAKEDFGKRIPFGFLDDIRLMFVNKYGNKAQEAIAYEYNDEFSRILQSKMVSFHSGLLLLLPPL